MPEFLSTDPANDVAVRVHTASLVVLDPCHLDTEVLIGLLEAGDAVLVLGTMDGEYPVTGNASGDIEVWNPAGEDGPLDVLPREAAVRYLRALGKPRD